MNSLQECIELIKEFGFEGEDVQFFKNDCCIMIMDNQIRLWYNIPGIDKEYIGPPLPSKEELRKFIKENTF
jgi:hypothetical protein